jgi:hypothetical protein
MPQPPPKLRSLFLALAAMVAAFLGARYLPWDSTTGSRADFPPTLTEKLPAASVAPPAQATPPISAQSLLAEAAAEKDFFRAAANSLTAIEHLTAADFVEFTARGKLPSGITDSGSTLLQHAVAQAFVDRWFAVTPEKAAAALIALTPRDADGYRTVAAAALRSVLARSQPLAFLAAAKDSPPEPSTYSHWPLEDAFIALATRDLLAARRLAAELPELQRQAADSAIAQGIAEVDPVAAMRLAQANPRLDGVLEAALYHAERAGPGIVRQVLEAGLKDRLDEDSATRLRILYPDLEVAPGPSPTFPSLPSVRAFSHDHFEPPRVPLTPEEAQARLAQSDHFPEAIRGKMVSALVEDWAIEAPEAALAWARDHQENLDQGPLQAAFKVWTQADESAALGWLEKQPPSPRKSTLSNGLAVNLAERGDLATALRLYSGADLSAKKDSAELAFLASTATRQDPALAANWLASLPDLAEAEPPLRQTLGQWQAQDPEAAGQWVDALPPGALRDSAAAALAEAVVPQSFAAAVEWLNTIDTADRRRAAVRAIYSLQTQRNPVAARTWLRTRPEIDVNSRDRLLRITQPRSAAPPF